MSKIGVETGVTGVGPGEAKAGEVSQNSFSVFIDAHSDGFSVFNNTQRELRETRKAWETAIHPQLELSISMARRELGGFQGRVEDKIRAGVTNLILDLEGPDLDPDAQLYFDADGRHRIIIAQGLPELRQHYREAAAPLVAELSGFQADFSQEMVARMASEYDFLVDMRTFLTDPAFGRQRELASGIFRNIAAVDSAFQTKAQPGFFSPVRVEWQTRAQDLSTAYDPNVFKRFWESEKSGVAAELIEYIRFGALMAKAERDEAGMEPPTTQELQHAIGRLPIDTWPKKLREAYLTFYKTDSAALVATISSKIRELFPKSAGRNGNLPQESAVHSSKRKHRGEGVVQREGSERTADAMPANGSEAEAKGFKLAIIKKDPEGRSSHKAYQILPEEVEEVIQGLAEAGSDELDMREDISETLRRLIASPYQPGTKRLSKPSVFFSVEGHHRVPFREFDPNGMTDFSFRHPQSWRLRIIYGVVGDTVMLRRVMSHDVLDKIQKTDPKSL